MVRKYKKKKRTQKQGPGKTYNFRIKDGNVQMLY